MVKAKVDQCPTSLLTQILPPCTSMNFRQSVSPRNSVTSNYIRPASIFERSRMSLLAALSPCSPFGVLRVLAGSCTV